MRSQISGWLPAVVKDAVTVSDQGIAFSYLNQIVEFPDIESIDWNHPSNGKLWLYNLTYFDFLQDPDIPHDRKDKLILSFLSAWEDLKDGLEPYPVTLRVMNLIKYASALGTTRYDAFIQTHLEIIRSRLEYHLMGNHLIENALALQFGAIYLEDKSLGAFSGKFLHEQLNEQILSDGGHFERSPMYHRILLSRLLDLIYLQQKKKIQTGFFTEIISFAVKMLSWMDQMTFNSGRSPNFYDSQFGIAHETHKLLRFAADLGISPNPDLVLSDSGFRRFSGARYECFINLSGVIADYIPGHAHADIFHFDLEVDGKAVFVDTGVSSYIDDEHRQFERSTSAHNTVEVSGENQSDVWGAFRLGHRAKVLNMAADERAFSAQHNGYQNKCGILHGRQFEFHQQSIKIFDRLEGREGAKGVARLHLPPDLKAKSTDKNVNIGEIELHFEGGTPAIENYSFARGFNDRVDAQVITIPFQHELITSIRL